MAISFHLSVGFVRSSVDWRIQLLTKYPCKLLHIVMVPRTIFSNDFGDDESCPFWLSVHHCQAKISTAYSVSPNLIGILPCIRWVQTTKVINHFGFTDCFNVIIETNLTPDSPKALKISKPSLFISPYWFVVWWDRHLVPCNKHCRLQWVHNYFLFFMMIKTLCIPCCWYTAWYT